MILDSTATSIRTIAKCHDFVNVIDVREDLKWFNSTKHPHKKSRITLINKLISISNIISRARRLDFIRKKAKNRQEKKDVFDRTIADIMKYDHVMNDMMGNLIKDHQENKLQESTLSSIKTDKN